MIDRIEALCEKATPGPWERSPFLDTITGPPNPDNEYLYPVLLRATKYATADDLSLAAHARQLLPLMLEVVKAADNYLNKYGTAVDLDNSLEHLDAYCAERLPG